MRVRRFLGLCAPLLVGVCIALPGPCLAAAQPEGKRAHAAQVRFAKLLQRHAERVNEGVLNRARKKDVVAERKEHRAELRADRRSMLEHAVAHPRQATAPTRAGTAPASSDATTSGFLTPGGISMVASSPAAVGGGAAAAAAAAAAGPAPVGNSTAATSQPTLKSGTFSTLSGVGKLLTNPTTSPGVTLGGTPPPTYVQLNVTAINPNVPPLLITDLNNIVANINTDLATLINDLNSGLNNLLTDLNHLFPAQ